MYTPLLFFLLQDKREQPDHIVLVGYTTLQKLNKIVQEASQLSLIFQQIWMERSILLTRTFV
jgi:hypothetical protein